MIGKVLEQAPHIIIEYDMLHNILYADWIGQQTKASVEDGCERILYFLRLHRVSKVLNDNTHLNNIWSEASEWVALNWFPRLSRAGCKYFAHVYSPDLYGKLSAEKALDFGIRDILVATFNGKDMAETWLKNVT